MFICKYHFPAALVSLLSLTGVAQPSQGALPVDTGNRTLIVFFDGLRPDYITAADMPRLFAFKQTACYGTRHHSVFPTVTRMNASSYSTGSYPEHHGLMGNTVYFPQVDRLKGLNTGDAADLKRIDSATRGQLLTAGSSLGQVLQQNGQKMMVFSSGSTGQALLQNHTVSGITINPAMILPDSLRQTILQEVGPVPRGGNPESNGHVWITDALMKYALVDHSPLVSAIWYAEPDGAAHRYGIGSAEARAALRLVDTQFGRILDSLQSRQLEAKTNILISTDHGFVSYIGKQKLEDFLIGQGLKAGKTSDEVIVVEGAIYVKDHDSRKIREIVKALQSQEWVGPVFTRGRKKGDLTGQVEGTLSFESIHWDHPERAADILTASNWDDRKNPEGYAGASYSVGVAGHGGLSPYEVQIPLMARGPAFKQAFTDTLPTSNIDLVPTVLHLHRLPVPPAMDGRVMYELLKTAPTGGSKARAVVQQTITRTHYEGGTYELELRRTRLGKYQYVDFTTIRRTAGRQTAE